MWSSWSNGGEQSHTIDIPAASDAVPKFVAEFSQFTGTFAPTMAPTESYRCVPGFFGIVAKEIPLLNEEAFVNEEYGVFIEQQSDGNLVVRYGTPENPGEVVWASGATGDASSYYTTLNGESNLMTYEGSPENEGIQLWKTNTVNPEGDYFLGIDCTSEIVSVYAGRWNNPGVAVWNSAPTSPPTTSPTMSPTTKAPTASPTATPTALGTPAPVDRTGEPTEMSEPADGVFTETSSSSINVLSMAFTLILPAILLQLLI